MSIAVADLIQPEPKMETRAPVTVIAKVKKDLALGARLEVECVESVAKKGTMLTGKWVFYLLTDEPDGNEFRSQVVVWGTMETKIVKTVLGLASLASDLNVSVPEIPLMMGRKGIWRVDELDRNNK